MEVVPVAQRDVVHYLLGRVTEDDFRQFQQQRIPNPPPVGSIGLFTAARSAIPDSFGRVGESIEEAMQQRLQTRLKSLLAGQILKTLVTGESSSLKVSITIKPLSSSGESTTVPSWGNQESQTAQPQKRSSVEPLQFKPETNIQVQVQNNESRNLYISTVLIDSSGNLIVLFPLDWDEPEEAALVPPGKILAFPNAGDKFQIRLKGPSGTLEVLVLASVKPVRTALIGLKNIARSRNLGRGSPLALSEDEPVEVMGNLLRDLDEISRATVEIIPNGVQAVDTTQLAAMSAIIQVVDK